MKLSGTMIGTENSKVLGDFYNKILGEAGWQEGDWYGYQAGTGTLMIGTHSDVSGKNATPARLMINFEVTDVKAEFEKIKALGAEVVAEPYQPSPTDNPEIWLATFADPDGNYFQLATPWENKG